jgi:hypothetical protein
MRHGRKCGSNWGCYCFLFEKKTLKRFVQCHVLAQSPPRRRPHVKYRINTSQRSSFGKNVVLPVLFGSKGNSCTIYKQSDMCIYTHIPHNMETLVGQKKERKKKGKQ